MKSVADIFELWPSVAEIGRDLDLPYPTVAAWKQRGSIPVAYWRAVIDAKRRRGHSDISGDVLVQVHDAGAANAQPTGLSEGSSTTLAETPGDEPLETGQFTRWKHLRRPGFATREEIVEHVRSLRSEWDRR